MCDKSDGVSQVFSTWQKPDQFQLDKNIHILKKAINCFSLTEIKLYDSKSKVHV